MVILKYQISFKIYDKLQMLFSRINTTCRGGGWGGSGVEIYVFESSRLNSKCQSGGGRWEMDTRVRVVKVIYL